jgi:23S rRNA (uracil1939-C5)-methyltransferase
LGRGVTERLVITGIGQRGDGIVKTPAGALYVPGALAGETVEVERVEGHPDRRHMLALNVSSPDRITPICRYFGSCGGCALQHMGASAYRAFKRDLVVSALSQVRLSAELDDLVDAHGVGRRRAVLHARSSRRGMLEVGFAAARSHRIVAIDRCPVLAPELEGALDLVSELAKILAPRQKPLDVWVTATRTGFDIEIRGSGVLPPAVMANLAEICEEHRLARLTRHGELIVRRAQPVVLMGRANVPLPPAAFLQPTAAGEAELARQVQAHVGACGTVADLFAGVGSFALRLAERARVTAVDRDGAAILALRQAKNTTPGLKPITAQQRDLFRRPLPAAELCFEAVVFDPPRQGAQAQAAELARSRVPVVIAVSCNPATFARDARILVDGGYRLTRVSPVDQFRYTSHVEIVARFER